MKLTPMTDADFDKGNKKWLDLGVHKVYISTATRGKTDKGTEFIEFEVETEAGETGSARKYITEKAAPWTRNFLAGLAVHNQTSEEDKEKVRNSFKKAVDTDDWDDKYLEKFLNFQAWVDVYEDETAPNPNGGYYKRTELFRYEPKHKTLSHDAQVNDLISNSTPVELDDVPFN